MAQLMHAVARLTADERGGAGRLPAELVLPALTCRDTVLRELQQLSAALPDANSTSSDRDARPAAGSGLPPLREALQGLPVMTGRDRLDAVQALIGTGDLSPLAAGWRDAARAAVNLEAQHDEVRALTDPDSIRLITRDVAELAAALPYLDSDLAAALGPAQPARTVLLDPAAHSQLQLAAERVQVQTAGLTEPATQPAGRSAAARASMTVRPVSGVLDVTRATRDLTAMLSRRGPEVSGQEAAAVGHLLLAGVEVTARVLDGGPPRAAADAASAAGHLHDARRLIPELLHSPVETLTPVSRTIVALAEQATDRIGTLSKLLDGLPDPAQANRTDTGLVLPAELGQLPALTSEWAVHSADLAKQLHHGLRQAAAAGRLFVPSPGSGRQAGSRYPWQSLAAAHAHHHPALTALDRAATALTRAVPSLTVLAGGRLQSRPEPRQLAEAAAGRAALAELRAALQTHSPTQPPHLHRPTRSGATGRGRA